MGAVISSNSQVALGDANVHVDAIFAKSDEDEVVMSGQGSKLRLQQVC